MLEHRKVALPIDTLLSIGHALDKGQLTRGPYIEMVEEEMRGITGCKYAVATSSGSMALQLAIEGMNQKRISDVPPTVAVPALGFVVDASIPVSLGMDVLFIDVEMKTWVISQDYAEKSGADVVIAVHMGGVRAPVINHPRVIYDSAHYVGPCPGVTSIFSFHPSKIISGAEGGCITTDDEDIYKHAKKMRCFGFEEGRRYIEYAEYGYKGMMTNLSAIIIYHNLIKLQRTLEIRTKVRDMLNMELGLENTGLGMYMVPVSDPDDILLNTNGFVRHYPRTLPWQFAEYGVTKQTLMNAQWASEHLISVPFHEFMTPEDVGFVLGLLENKVIKI